LLQIVLEGAMDARKVLAELLRGTTFKTEPVQPITTGRK